MAKPKTTYQCSECGATTTKWVGQCPSCKSYATLEEAEDVQKSSVAVGTKSKGIITASNPAQRVQDITSDESEYMATGIGELDRVLGGGLVAGGVIILAGPPGVGKALALDTPMLTSDGWKTIGEIRTGDKVYGDDGQRTSVVALSEIWEDRPCYELVFSDGEKIIADENHEWKTLDIWRKHTGEGNLWQINNDYSPESILTTKEIFKTLFVGKEPRHAIRDPKNIDSIDENYAINSNSLGYRFIVSAKLVPSVPVRCIEVDNESHMFLAGNSLIPTHNSSILASVSDVFSKKSNVLYVSGEESVNQVKIRHERMNAMGEHLYLAAESDLAKVLWQIDEVKPDLLIVDSLQAIASNDIEGRAGSMSQVTEVATILTRIAKDRDIPTILVGHYTKDGNLAGPRVVEHLVDVVLAFEGEEDSPLRMLRGIKNRFGAADEIGCFEHTEEGLKEVPDPSGMLLGSREESIPGVATSIFLEGKRAIPVEIQALVLESPLPNPRKGTSGLDPTRTMMLQAVLQKHSGFSVRLADKDVYVSTAGGIKVRDPGTDLATMVALASDALNLPSRFDAAALGEVTLSGEIRKVPGIGRRVAEAERLGFKIALIPAGSKSLIPDSIVKRKKIILMEIKNLRHMINFLKGTQVAMEAGELT